MGKTVSVIVYIKVSVFSLVFGCLCCVLLLLLLLFTVFVCFVLVFFFIVSGLLFFWLCCCSSQSVSSKKHKVYWGSAHHEGPEVRKGALVVGLEMDGGACAPASKCEYIFLLFFNGFLREIFCCRRWGKKFWTSACSFRLKKLIGPIKRLNVHPYSRLLPKYVGVGNCSSQHGNII